MSHKIENKQFTPDIQVVKIKGSSDDVAVPFNQINLLDTFIIEHAEMMIDRLQVLQSSMPDLPNQLSNETLIKTLEETIEDIQWLILV